MFFSSIRAPLVALVAYVVSLGSSTPSVSSLPSLTVGTATSDLNIDGSGGLKVTATVVNTGGESLKLLNDPRGVLDPFPENTFTFIGPSDSPPPFRGARAFYNSTLVVGLDDPSLFTVLAPGGSVDITHDLSAAYDFTRSGTGEYSVKPSNLFTYVDADGSPKDLYATVEDIAKVKVSVDLGVSRRVHNKRYSFINCSPSQEWKIANATNAAHRIISHSHRYDFWFGATNLNQYRRVRARLGWMTQQSTFTNMDFTCHDDETPRSSGLTTPAYLQPGTTRDMTVLPSFFTGLTRRQRVHMMVHQASHVYATADFAFGDEASWDLARLNPGEAVLNADSYANFVMNYRNHR